MHGRHSQQPRNSKERQHRDWKLVGRLYFCRQWIISEKSCNYAHNSPACHQHPLHYVPTPQPDLCRCPFLLEIIKSCRIVTANYSLSEMFFTIRIHFFIFLCNLTHFCLALLFGNVWPKFWTLNKKGWR